VTMPGAALPRDANSVVGEFADADGQAAPAHEDAAGFLLTDTAVLGYGEDVLFGALAITDTTQHNSATSDCRGYRSKAIFVTTSLNQSANVSVDVSRDGVTWVVLGAAAALPAGTYTLNGNETGASPGQTSFVAGLSNPWPYVRVHATCPTAPTSGTLSAWLEKRAG
jgi:hypothetical protein